MQSLPVRGRGLKIKWFDEKDWKCAVVTHGGSWIEIFYSHVVKEYKIVVPLAGTWIEIMRSRILQGRICVVPLAGTWIEIK